MIKKTLVLSVAVMAVMSITACGTTTGLRGGGSDRLHSISSGGGGGHSSVNRHHVRDTRTTSTRPPADGDGTGGAGPQPVGDGGGIDTTPTTGTPPKA